MKKNKIITLPSVNAECRYPAGRYPDCLLPNELDVMYLDEVKHCHWSKSPLRSMNHPMRVQHSNI